MNCLKLVLSLLPSLLLAGVTFHVTSHCLDEAKTLEVFKAELRGAFFTAFLALGGFLLSLKTFIVVKMKESVYESPEYVEVIKEIRQSNPGVAHFGPLKNLSELLFFSILACFLAAAAQFTIGFIDHIAAASFCISIAVLALLFLVTSLVVTRRNLRQMFKYLEDRSRKNHQPNPHT